jgi:hypothetical protein
MRVSDHGRIANPTITSVVVSSTAAPRTSPVIPPNLRTQWATSTAATASATATTTGPCHHRGAATQDAPATSATQALTDTSDWVPATCAPSTLPVAAGTLVRQASTAATRPAVTAMMTAEQVVKNREEIKKKSMALASQKIGPLLLVEDIVLRDIDLSPELEKAIEAKMVAEQQANQARFTQVQTQTESETAVISAKGEAEAIRVRGEALRQSPSFLRWKIVERWNGRSPMVIPPPSDHNAAGLLLPISPAETPSTP